MADLKTQPGDADVDAFLATVEDERRREECRTVMHVMAEVTGEPPRMWGTAIIGFGSYHYVYESGREGDWMLTGVSPRKKAMSVYILPDLDAYAEELGRLGRHSTGRSCLYINRLDDVDLDVLRDLIASSVADLKKRCG